VVLFKGNEDVHEGELEVQEVLSQRLNDKTKDYQFEANEPFDFAFAEIDFVELLKDFQFSLMED
jgi:hypothetical protein